MSDLPELAYSRPRHLDEALQALGRRGACVYAGGTDLLVALTAREAWTERIRELVDIKDLDVAKGIAQAGDSLRIGALVTADELASSRLVRREAPALAEAARATSAPALRRRGTVGGNLVTPHPAGDVATALLALGATVELVESGATHERALADVLERSATRRAGPRLILAVRFRKCRRSAFEKHGSRAEFSRSIAAAAVALREDGVRVAIGGLGARPFVAARAATAPTDAHAARASLVEDCRAFGDALVPTDYRLVVADTLISRALARARRA